MEFVRKRKRGQDKKVRRTWFSEEGYRIVWRKEVHGVCVPARFQACVRTLIPYSGGELRQMWDFVNHKRRLIKTLAAAQEECEKHHRLWTKACEAGGIRALRELFGGKLPSGLPVWSRKKMDRRLYAILTDNRPLNCRDDEEEDEPCTENQASDAPGPRQSYKTFGLFCLAHGSDIGNRYPCLACRGQGRIDDPADPPCPVEGYRKSADASTVPPAEAAGRARKKPAAKRTAKSSKRTARRKTGTTGSSASAAKRSKGSRKRKSALSGS